MAIKTTQDGNNFVIGSALYCQANCFHRTVCHETCSYCMAFTCIYSLFRKNQL